MIDGTPIKGVIFDLDGTLYRLRKPRLRMTLSLWRSIGIVAHLGTARAVVRNRQFRDRKALRQAFADELGRRARVAPEEAARWYDEEFFGTFVELLRRKAAPRPDLLPFLGRLRAKGARLAVVSDIAQVDRRLRALGIPPEAFDITLCAETCGELKPSPASLLSVAQHWALDPRAIVVVGDRVDRDASAARAAKMQCVILDNRPRLLGRHRRRDGETLHTWKEASRAIAAGVGIRSG